MEAISVKGFPTLAFHQVSLGGFIKFLMSNPTPMNLNRVFWQKYLDIGILRTFCPHSK